MKNTVFLTLTLLILASCAHRTVDGPTPLPAVVEKKAPTEAKVENKARAIFHVVEPLGVHIILLNLDKNAEETVFVDKTLSSVVLKPGFWQVSGFILKDKRYKMMNTTKQFIFHIKKNENTYVGSYIFQCPKVNQSHLKAMKQMSFFNRYAFSSQQRLCELVVGSDFENVNRVWMELEKSQHLPLSLGF